MPEAERLLGSYYRYQAMASCVFFSPVFYVYYQDVAGLALPTILGIQSYYLALRAVLDVPLGALADRYSRRACLATYALGHVAGSTLVLVSPTLAGVVVAETVFAVASAARSGADSAYLFDLLAVADRLDLYPRAESRAQALVSLSAGTTGVVGGLLAGVHLGLPYVATIVAAALSAVLVWRLGREGTAHGRARSLGALLTSAGRHAARSPRVRWVMALAAYTVVASHVYYYTQQPYLRAIGVPVAAFGALFAATKIVTALVASAAHHVDRAIRPRMAAAVMAVIPVVGLGAMSAAGGPAAAGLLLSRGLLDGLWQPLNNVYLNRLVPSELRATMLSAQSFGARLALAGAVALLGIGTARAGLADTLAGAALAAGLAGGALVVLAPRSLAAERPCDSRGA